MKTLGVALLVAIIVAPATFSQVENLATDDGCSAEYTFEECYGGQMTPGNPPPSDQNGNCFGSQQCNTYPNVTRQYDPENGYYCGGQGSGCTECVNSYCDYCTTTDSFCIPG